MSMTLHIFPINSNQFKIRYNCLTTKTNYFSISRSRHHAKSVSWLRRTEYISTEQTRFQPQTIEKVEAKVGFNINKNFKVDIYNIIVSKSSFIKIINCIFRKKLFIWIETVR